MKEQILQQLSAALSAMDHVAVMGRQNMDNQRGAMAIIEAVIQAIGQCEIVGPNKEESKKK